MRRKSSFIAVFLLATLILSQNSELLLSAQTAIPTAQQLDQLLAPVALYPDSLLAQITTASTNPQEILDVDNWLQQNPGLQGSALTDAAEKKGFDPAFIALVTFPTVLEMMAQHIDDYAAIGQAFSADQGAVMASIQRLRAQAYAAGTLRSNPQQQVEVQQSSGQTIYVIQPTNPQVVYVPLYNPTVVYVQPTTTVAAASLISFGAGIAIGALLVGSQPWGWGGWGWSWGTHRVYYNHTVWVRWGNPYRPPNYWYRPRPVPYSHRPGYGGNWRYRPPNYRPPYRAGLPGYSRPPYGPGNRPGYRPPGHRPIQPPRPGVPTQPIARPYTQKQPGAAKPPVRQSSQGKPNPPSAYRPPTNGANPPAANRPPASRPNTRPSTGPQSQVKPAAPVRSSTQPPVRQQPRSGSQSRRKSALRPMPAFSFQPASISEPQTSVKELGRTWTVHFARGQCSYDNQPRRRK